MADLIYRPLGADDDSIYELWSTELGSMWPISKNILLWMAKKGGVEGSFVAEKEGLVVGFVITKLGKKGEIMSIVIDKKYQRQRIGSELMGKAMENFRSKGISEIQLGAGANPYLWPGVPDNLPGAIAFFDSMGWKYDEESVDMVGGLNDYVTPHEFNKSINELGIRLIVADKTIEREILEFEKTSFPQWLEYYESALAGESGEKVLIAIDCTGKVLGTVLVGKKSVTWNKLLGEKVGTMGALGVKESARRQGIGLALAAKATEILKDAGLEKAYLGWTWLVNWYGRLGYKVWRKYKMAYKSI